MRLPPPLARAINGETLWGLRPALIMGERFTIFGLNGTLLLRSWHRRATYRGGYAGEVEGSADGGRAGGVEGGADGGV